MNDIIFDSEVGYESVAITDRSEEVGDNKLNNPIPSAPSFLVIIIFNIKPINLPKIPPISSISVDLINTLFFILFNIFKYMIVYIFIVKLVENI